MNDLFLLEDLRRTEHNLVTHVDWVALKGHIPVFQLLCLHEHTNATIDLADFLLRLHTAEG